MKRIILLFFMCCLSFILMADTGKLAIEFPNIENNAIYQSLILETVRKGWIILIELFLAAILQLITAAWLTKTNSSQFWQKYKITRVLIAEMLIITAGVLFYFSIRDLPKAIDYLFNPESVLYKYFLKQ